MGLTIKEYVALVMQGEKQLGEIPIGMRDSVKLQVKQAREWVKVENPKDPKKSLKAKAKERQKIIDAAFKTNNKKGKKDGKK